MISDLWECLKWLYKDIYIYTHFKITSKIESAFEYRLQMALMAYLLDFMLNKKCFVCFHLNDVAIVSAVTK